MARTSIDMRGWSGLGTFISLTIRSNLHSVAMDVGDARKSEQTDKNKNGRECWCAQSISGIAGKLDDGQCSFPCEGNTSMACGGSLKLSVYKLSSAGRLAAQAVVALGCIFVAGLSAI